MDIEQARTFLEIVRSGGAVYGVGIDGNIITASVKALVSGVNRGGMIPLAVAG